MLDIHKYIPSLVPMYNEPHRLYHSLQHIHGLSRMITTKSYVEMLDQKRASGYSRIPLNTQNGFEVEKQLMFLAWFHDCYYDPYLGSPGNEKISENIFVSMTSNDVDGSREETLFYDIRAGIELTSKHLLNVTENFTGGNVSLTNLIFMDLDMSSFSDKEEFTRNNSRVRAEYYKTSPSDYLKGRIKFLESLLKKPRIYYIFSDKYENAARANIKESIIESRKMLDNINEIGY